MKLLLYCTKAKPYLYDLRNIMGVFEGYNVKQAHLDHLLLNGKIVAECDFEVEKIEQIKSWNSTEDYDYEFETPTLYYETLLEHSCLTCDEFEEYIEFEGYAIHIKNLHIFDEPRDTREYNTYNRYGKVHIADIPIRKAPQNMMYAFDYYGNPFVLISIKPEWLCKILNGEETIEVRRKVLKEMK